MSRAGQIMGRFMSTEMLTILLFEHLVHFERVRGLQKGCEFHPYFGLFDSELWEILLSLEFNSPKEFLMELFIPSKFLRALNGTFKNHFERNWPLWVSLQLRKKILNRTLDKLDPVDQIHKAIQGSWSSSLEWFKLNRFLWFRYIFHKTS